MEGVTAQAPGGATLLHDITQLWEPAGLTQEQSQEKELIPIGKGAMKTKEACPGS